MVAKCNFCGANNVIFTMPYGCRKCGKMNTVEDVKQTAYEAAVRLQAVEEEIQRRKTK